MRRILIGIVLFIVALSACTNKQPKQEFKLPYIPKNMEDCFKEIDKLWGTELRKEVSHLSEDDFAISVYTTYGMWIRNNWELWKDGRLTRYFNSYGIYNAERTSMVIWVSYYRYVKGVDIKFDEQVRIEKEFWRTVGRSPSDTPKQAGKINFYMELERSDRTSGQHFVHISHSKKRDKYVWIYDDRFGWGKLTKAELNTLKLAGNNIDTLLSTLKTKGSFLKK